MLTHRPPSPSMLAAVLKAEDRKNAAVEYMGNALWRLMMYFQPKTNVPIFSRYMSELGKPVKQQTGKEILNDLIEKLKQRRGGENA